MGNRCSGRTGTAGGSEGTGRSQGAHGLCLACDGLADGGAGESGATESPGGDGGIAKSIPDHRSE